MSWQLSITGLFIGALVGMTGMGGGSLMTPVLVLFLGFHPATAIGTDIVHGAALKWVGAWRQRSLGNVAARLSGWMLLGSAPMSLVGVWLSTWLTRHYGDGVTSVGGRMLSIALLAGGLGLLCKTLIGSREDRVERLSLQRRDRVVAVMIGLFGGFIVGLTSVGSGVFFALTLLLAFPLKSAKVVGTDILHAAALLTIAGAGHLVAGNVNLGAVAWLLVGSVPGILLGSHFTVRIPERALRGVLATTLIIASVAMLKLPGSSTIVVLGLAAGVLALVVQSIRKRVALAASRR